MNGEVKKFLPRILTLIYQHKYLSKNNNNIPLPMEIDNNNNKKKKLFEFNRKMVYIHDHIDNREKSLSLQLFCSNHDIPHVLVRNEDHVKKLILYLTNNVREQFVYPITGSYLDSDWGKDNCLLNSSIKHLILRLPYITEKNNEEIIKYFGCIGALINANKQKLRVAFNNKPANFLYKFFR